MSPRRKTEHADLRFPGADQPQGPLRILQRRQRTGLPALPRQAVAQDIGGIAVRRQPVRRRPGLTAHLDPLVSAAGRHQHSVASGPGGLPDRQHRTRDMAQRAAGG